MSLARRTCALVAVVVAVALPSSASGAKPKPHPAPTAKPTKPNVVQPPPIAPVSTTSIPVTVAEVAAKQAYLRPGAKGGVFRGAQVTIEHKSFTVVQTTDSFAVINLGDATLKEHERGVATTVAEETTKAKELPKPAPFASFTPLEAPVPPAASQSPKFVPIGNTAGVDRRYDLRLTAGFGAMFPLNQAGQSIVSTELNVRAHAEPFHAPAAFDLDASLQQWIAPGLSTMAGGGARPFLRVRQLTASLGSPVGFFGAVGRLPYAASTLGTLDGLRVSAPLGGGVTLGAFGGLLPNPLSGAPSASAERFGVEARYSNTHIDLRPEAALVVNGSMFQGKLDERRVSALIGLYPGPARFGAHVEVSNFAADNPWKAKAIEVTGAGLDVSARKGVFEFGGRFDLRQPERSLWLASFLPVSWFCRAVPSTPGATTPPDACDGSVSSRVFGEVDASVHFNYFSLLLGATTTGDLTQSNGSTNTVGGFLAARVMRLAKVLRFDLTGSASKATYMNMFGGQVGPGVSVLHDSLDISAYYRASFLEYRSDSGLLLQHGIGAVVMFFPSAPVFFALQGEGIAGTDVQALQIFGTVTWRPRL